MPKVLKLRLSSSMQQNINIYIINYQFEMDARLSERIRHESIPAEFGYIEDKHRPEIEDR